MKEYEKRSTERLKVPSVGRSFEGVALRWDQPSRDDIGFTETVENLTISDQVSVLVAHDPAKTLATTRSGTANVWSDETGVRFQFEAPSTSLGEDVLELVGRGIIDSVSAGFILGRDSWSEDSEGRLYRTIHEGTLIEISLTSDPVYPETSIDLRSVRDALSKEALEDDVTEEEITEDEDKDESEARGFPLGLVFGGK